MRLGARNGTHLRDLGDLTGIEPGVEAVAFLEVEDAQVPGVDDFPAIAPPSRKQDRPPDENQGDAGGTGKSRRRFPPRIPRCTAELLKQTCRGRRFPNDRDDRDRAETSAPGHGHLIRAVPLVDGGRLDPHAHAGLVHQ